MSTSNIQGDLLVEDKGVHRERIISHYIIYYTQFLIIITFGTILVGLWPYLNKVDPTASKIFLGYLFASSGLSQTIFSPIVGYCSNQLSSNRILFMITIVINIISLLIHALVESLPSHRKYWLLVSRLLSGIASGVLVVNTSNHGFSTVCIFLMFIANVTICRSHISATTLIDERRKAVSLLSSTSIIALGLGAGIQYTTIPIGDAGFYIIPGVNLNMYSAVAWILIILEIINLFLFLPSIFKEHSMVGKTGMFVQKDSYKIRNYRWLAWVFIAFNFLVTFHSTFERVLGTPMAMDQFGMDREKAVSLTSVINIIGAVISFLVSVMINVLCKYLSEFRTLMLGLGLFVVGRCLFYPMGSGAPPILDHSLNVTVGCPTSQEWCRDDGRVTLVQFVAGMLVEKVAYTVSIILTMVMLSKILGTKPQGTWMGILTSAGSLARIIAPVIIARIYTSYGPGVISISTNIGFMLASIVLLKIADYCILDNEDEENESVNNKVDHEKECLKNT